MSRRTGKGIIPNITPDPDTGIGDWSQSDIVETLTTGFLPDFDTLGGAMGAVQDNLSQLTPEDRQAIAAYLKSVPPVRSQKQ